MHLLIVVSLSCSWMYYLVKPRFKLLFVDVACVSQSFNRYPLTFLAKNELQDLTFGCPNGAGLATSRSDRARLVHKSFVAGAIQIPLQHSYQGPNGLVTWFVAAPRSASLPALVFAARPRV